MKLSINSQFWLKWQKRLSFKDQNDCFVRKPLMTPLVTPLMTPLTPLKPNELVTWPTCWNQKEPGELVKPVRACRGAVCLGGYGVVVGWVGTRVMGYGTTVRTRVGTRDHRPGPFFIDFGPFSGDFHRLQTRIKRRSIAAFSVKTVIFMKIRVFHENHHFLVIERTNSCHTVSSDWRASWFGNDEHFLTRPGQKCTSGHRTGSPLPEKSSKSVPSVVSINGC